MIEKIIEKFLFRSRWFLAPLYIGLVLSLFMVMIKFAQEFILILPNILKWHAPELIISVLELVDIVLIANLLLMIIFSGYENFVSKIGEAQNHVDRPNWMGAIDYGSLKLKVIGSIVAISSIQLLKSFINIQEAAKVDLAWMIGVHFTFVLSGLVFAFTEKVGHNNNH